MLQDRLVEPPSGTSPRQHPNPAEHPDLFHSTKRDQTAQCANLRRPHSEQLRRTGGIARNTHAIQVRDAKIRLGFPRTLWLGRTATKIDSVEIRWPSGTTDVIKNLEADKFYDVLEGKGLVPFEQIRPASPAD